ncbi:hypothetical protein ACN28E_24985 [Archangium lansingense]|uniref:hypothetical protein n=1 Tax=Archangium lansingense TaxID=2995310 RepID=UPI003B781744
MKTRALSLKRLGAPAASPPLSLATATGPVFAMLDPPGVEDAHGDTMDAGALELPPGVNEVPLYWVHSYHPEVVPDAQPHQRLPVGTATVWEEGGQWYFVPRFNRLTSLSTDVEAQTLAGEITACSIGYLTVAATPNGKGPEGTGEDVHKAKLLEVSLVDKGAKAGAVRVKAMAETQPGQEPTMDEQWKQMREDLAQTKAAVAKMAGQLDAMHAKAFPPPPPEEKKPEDAPPVAEPPKDEEAKTKSGNAVADWWQSKGFKVGA